MKTIKIYDRPILNFYDLHKEFSPYEIFSQLVLFDEFAEVHCLPLRAHIKGRVAEVLTKEFWLKILRRHEWPSANNPEELFRKIFGSELNETAKSEISDAEIFAKLKYITESSGQNPVNVILMLAISELAEIDARKIDASQWQKSGEYRVKSDEIKTFDYEKSVTLPAGGVYRFYYHDDERLSPGAVIRTVKIEAGRVNNKSAELTLELCAESDGTTIYALTLKQEEYIYCNAVDGKIIKFLPIISISEDLCIIRKKYASSELTIYQKDAESWTLDGDNVSSFAAGNSSTGFLLVNNDGKINYIFYNPAKDFFVRAALDTISRPVVEAVINSKGYQLLLNDGTIIASYKFNQEAKVVSISPVGRAPFPEIEEDFYNERF